MGTLYIVATPIGNLEDITIRAIKMLLTAEVICAEDTRHSGQLLSLLRVRYAADLHIEPNHRPKLISFYDEVEERKVPEILTLLLEGKSVALVSDAGTPLISDPGFMLVRACSKQGIPVRSIPGPSSVTAALSVGGIPANQFLFLGYLPEKKGKRQKLISETATLLHKTDVLCPTIVLLVPSHDYQSTIEELLAQWGNGTIVRVRELTKVHESTDQMTIEEAVQEKHIPQGEYVLLFSPQKNR